MYLETDKSQKDSNAEHIHQMYEQAIRSLPFRLHTGTKTVKPSPGGKQSGRFSYNTENQGKMK